MDQQRDDLVYRKINQLAACIIAVGAVVVLLLAIVAILATGQVRRLNRTVEDLQQRTARLEQRPEMTMPAAPDGGVDSGSGDEPAAEIPAVPPSSDRSRQIGVSLRALDAGDPRAAALLQELKVMQERGGPVDPLASIQASRHCLALEQYEDALTWCRLCLAVEPQNLEALVTAARAGLRSGLLAEASAWVERALVLDSGNAALQMLHADIGLASGEESKYVEALQRAKHDPAWAAEASAKLAAAALRAGDLQAAEAELDYCMAANAAFADCIVLGAQLDFARQRFDACIAAAESYLQTTPGDIDMGILYGRALHAAGRRAEADSALQGVAEIDADRADLWYHWGMVLLDERQFAAAAEKFERACAADPSLARAWHRLGVARTNQDNPTVAIEAFDRALEQAPDYAAAWFGKAVCLHQTADSGAAAEALQKAVDLDPALAEAGKRVPGLSGLLQQNPAESGS